MGLIQPTLDIVSQTARRSRMAVLPYSGDDDKSDSLVQRAVVRGRVHHYTFLCSD